MMIKVAFPIKKLTIFGITMLGLCLWAGNSMAQSEQEKSEMEQEKPIEKPLVENQSDHVDVLMNDSVISPLGTITSVKTPLPKKDTHLSGEGKKPDPAPSTLSFNIFLYIVDKFKAD